MNILLNPLTNYCRQLLFVISLLALTIYADCQVPADSLFEKVTIAVLKSASPQDEVKDGQRQLYLYSFMNVDAGLKHLYYHYKDSALGQMLDDTTVSESVRQKIKTEAQKDTISFQTPVHAAIDEMISKSGIASAANVQLNDTTKTKENAGEDMTQIWVIGGLIVLALLIVFVQRRKLFRKKHSGIQVSQKADEDVDSKPGPEKEDTKPVKNEKKLGELKKELDNFKIRVKQLEKAKGDLETAHTALTLEKNKLDKDIKAAGTERDNAKKQLASETKELTELKELYKDADNARTQLGKQVEFISRMTDQLKSKLPGQGQLFPEADSSVQSWFLIREVISGIRSQEFNILGTPNYCQWILGQNADFPELNITDRAGNAGIIGFCKSMKQMGVKKVAPNESYLILNNLKITQKIYDAI